MRPSLLAILTFAIGACEVMTGERSAAGRRGALPPKPYASHLMPSEVDGIALGLDWPSLSAARPAITHDSAYPAHGGPLQHFVWEKQDSAHVTYFFSEAARPDTAVDGPSASTHLAGVEVSPVGILRLDTAAYRRAVAARIARWDSLVGPADSVEVCWPQDIPGVSEPREWRRWHRPDVTLMLVSTPDEYLTPGPSPDTLWESEPAAHQRRSMLVVVQSAQLRYRAGVSGFMRSVSKCTPR